MKICIDTDRLKDVDIGEDEFFYLCSLYFNKNIDKGTFDKISKKGYTYILNFEDGYPINTTLTKSGVELVEAIFANSEIKEEVGNKDRFVVLAEKLRELFPTGKKSGTYLQWRDSTAIISSRLKMLVKKYGCKFTDEQAIQATKKYVASFHGVYTYMQVLKYYIIKATTVDGSSTCNSQFLSDIENLGQENNSNNWLNEIR